VMGRRSGEEHNRLAAGAQGVATSPGRAGALLPGPGIECHRQGMPRSMKEGPLVELAESFSIQL